MRKLLLAVLLSSSFLIAQDNGRVKDSKGQVTVTGCVSRASGDYMLMKQDPAMTYELQGTDKIKLQALPGAASGGDREASRPTMARVRTRWRSWFAAPR